MHQSTQYRKRIDEMVKLHESGQSTKARACRTRMFDKEIRTWLQVEGDDIRRTHGCGS